jgi:hypothetical protein
LCACELRGRYRHQPSSPVLLNLDAMDCWPLTGCLAAPGVCCPLDPDARESLVGTLLSGGFVSGVDADSGGSVCQPGRLQTAVAKTTAVTSCTIQWVADTYR